MEVNGIKKKISCRCASLPKCHPLLALPFSSVPIGAQFLIQRQCRQSHDTMGNTEDAYGVMHGVTRDDSDCLFRNRKVSWQKTVDKISK